MFEFFGRTDIGRQRKAEMNEKYATRVNFQYYN